MDRWWRPRYWGISARSAFVAGSVVLAASVLSGAALAFILYRELLAGVDAEAAGRVRDVVAGLQVDAVDDLDANLVQTDQRIVVVQVIDSSGKVLQRSRSAPDSPLIPSSTFGGTMRTGLPDPISPVGDVRIAGQVADGMSGRYTVLVGASHADAESTVKTVAVLLACGAPIVTAAAAAATYWLVGRSLRSVEAIRTRVADIGASDLTERVPVPSNYDEISSLAVTMNEMLARIEAGHSAQRRFVGDASHELRSPVAAILSALDVAAAHPELLNSDLAASTLRPEAHRMEALVEDLLLLARADEGAPAWRRRDVDLDDVVSTELGRVLRETSVTIDAELIPTRMVGDRGGLSRVMRNLLENAIRHAESRVDVRVYPDGSNAVVTVADDGPGIPEADRKRIFERFVRLDSGRARSGGGTGLGLAIVSEVVGAHGGTVTVDDRPGGGALIVVRVPREYAPIDQMGRRR